jgi:hypothetical protein
MMTLMMFFFGVVGSDTGVDIKEVLKKNMLSHVLLKVKYSTSSSSYSAFLEKYFLMGPQDGSDMVVR